MEPSQYPSGSESDANDIQPLLHGCSSIDNLSNAVQHAQSPLSRVQLGLLCFLRILDPLSFTQIFPYINQFMSDLHVTDDPTNIGFYSGLVESSFAICQLFAIYPWGLLSDIVGRRPVIIIGCTGLALSTAFFGLSKNFASALASRALAGLFSGNVAVIPSVLCEITDRTNQSVAFPFFGLWWPVGSIIGPLVGGAFSNPAARYPHLFDYEFFNMYPYSLPCFIVSATIGIGVILSIFFLKESLQRRPREDSGGELTYGAIGHQHKRDVSNESSSVRKLLSIPIIRALCASGCALSFVSTAFDVVFVLFCYYPISRGGLAFTVPEIGYALAMSGIIAALLQLLFMPALLRRFHHAKIYHFCVKTWVFTFVALPPLNILARRELDESTGMLDPSIKLVLWVWIAVILSMARVGFLAYSVNMLLIKEHSPSPSALGSTNALIQFFICFSRATSPAFVSLAFTVSADFKAFGGHLWILMMTTICLGSCYLSQKVVDESAQAS